MSRPSEHPQLDERRHAELRKDASRALRQSLLDAVLRMGTGDETECAALTVSRSPTPLAPAQLAAAHPGGAEARQQARAMYERCLAHYRLVVRAPYADGNADDAGAAVSAFVAANIRALRNVKVMPQVLPRLERQLHAVARLSSNWDRSGARDRQLYFEKAAILAVLIGESSTQAVLQGPAALENVRRAARAYLKELLGLNPDQLTIGDAGLALLGPYADTATAAPALAECI